MLTHASWTRGGGRLEPGHENKINLLIRFSCWSLAEPESTNKVLGVSSPGQAERNGEGEEDLFQVCFPASLVRGFYSLLQETFFVCNSNKLLFCSLGWYPAGASLS